MQLKDIAFKNLRRRKSKMLFLIFGMVFGIATIVTLFTLTTAMEKSVNTRFQEAGLKLVVVPKTDTASFSVGGIPVVTGVSYNAKDLPAASVEEIRAVQGADKIKVIAPKVMGTADVNGQKALLVGVDFPAEFKIKSWWELTGSRPEKSGQALVGSGAAAKVGVSVGGTIDVNGKRLVVTGILQETGADEDGIVFVHLSTAQEILGKNEKYSFVEITTIKDDAVAAGLSAEITKKLPDSRVRTVKEAAEARQELAGKFGRFSLVVSLVMVVIAALIITTTMMASVNERTREIGIFRAIGFRKAHITRIILLEAAIVSGISGVMGYLAGMGLAVVIAPLFEGFKLAVSWDPLFGTAVLSGAVLLGVLAGIYPASKAAGLDPADALRFI